MLIQPRAVLNLWWISPIDSFQSGLLFLFLTFSIRDTICSSRPILSSCFPVSLFVLCPSQTHFHSWVSSLHCSQGFIFYFPFKCHIYCCAFLISSSFYISVQSCFFFPSFLHKGSKKRSSEHISHPYHTFPAVETVFWQCQTLHFWFKNCIIIWSNSEKSR